MHECQIEERPNDMVDPALNQTMARCRCHSDGWVIRIPADPPFVCPSTNAGVKMQITGVQNW